MIARVLMFMFPGIKLGVSGENAECVIRKDGGEPYIAEWNRPEPQPTPAELAAAEPAAQAAWDAAEAERIAAAADRAELRAQFKAAHDRLVQISGGANPTNAQVIAAVRDIAGYQVKILRALYGILTD